MQAPAGGIPTSPTIVTGSQVAQSPTAVWRAFQAQRNELTGQLRELEDKRRWLSQQVTQTPSGASKSGLEARIAELDKRIASVDKQVADAEANISKSAAVPALWSNVRHRSITGLPRKRGCSAASSSSCASCRFPSPWRAASGGVERRSSRPFPGNCQSGSTGSIRRSMPSHSRSSASARGSDSSRA